MAQSSVHGGGVPTDIPHVLDERPDHVHEHVRPGLIVERADVQEVSEGDVDGLEELTSQHLLGHGREVNRKLQDLFQIVTPGYVHLRQRRLNSDPVEGDHVDEVWEVGCQADQLEDVADFVGGQSIDVVDYNDDRLDELCSGLTNLLPVRSDALLAAFQQFAEDLADTSGPLDPRTHEGQPP